MACLPSSQTSLVFPCTEWYVPYCIHLSSPSPTGNLVLESKSSVHPPVILVGGGSWGCRILELGRCLGLPDARFAPKKKKSLKIAYQSILVPA